MTYEDLIQGLGENVTDKDGTVVIEDQFGMRFKIVAVYESDGQLIIDMGEAIDE